MRIWAKPEVSACRSFRLLKTATAAKTERRTQDAGLAPGRATHTRRITPERHTQIDRRRTKVRQSPLDPWMSTTRLGSQTGSRRQSHKSFAFRSLSSSSPLALPVALLVTALSVPPPSTPDRSGTAGRPVPSSCYHQHHPHATKVPATGSLRHEIACLTCPASLIHSTITAHFGRLSIDPTALQYRPLDTPQSKAAVLASPAFLPDSCRKAFCRLARDTTIFLSPARPSKTASARNLFSHLSPVSISRTKRRRCAAHCREGRHAADETQTCRNLRLWTTISTTARTLGLLPRQPSTKMRPRSHLSRMTLVERSSLSSRTTRQSPPPPKATQIQTQASPPTSWLRGVRADAPQGRGCHTRHRRRLATSACPT